MRGVSSSFHPSRALTRAAVAAAGFAAAASVAVHTGAAAAALAAASSFACATTAACVSGQNAKTGPGMAGTSAKGTGVSGSGVTGVSGASSTPGGRGVWGNFSTATDTYGGAGVYGTANQANIGVVGESDGLDAVGVAGSSKKGYGVLASGGSFGLQASSSGGIPINAVSDGDNFALLAEVFGSKTYALPAISATNDSSNGAGGRFIAHFGLVAETNSTSGYPLILDNNAGANVFFVNNAGDVYYTGTLNSFTRIAGGANVTEYAAKAASPTLEDTGTAQLVNGAAVVRLDPTFAASIETTVPYRVFVTPDGDLSHALFVAQKTPAGFIVRETQGGRSTLSFDYRVVATALGASGQRMSVANLASTPHIPLPSTSIAPRPAFPVLPHTQ